MKNYAIEIENLSKRFYIGNVQNGDKTLKTQLQQMLIRPLTRFASVWRGRAPTYVDKELWALRDINIKIEAGESVGIIGQNGSGKSTLLQLIANLMKPTEGQVVTRGHMVAMLNVGTGFHQELTGRENLYINGTVLGLTPNKIDELYDDIVEFAEIEEFMDTPLKRYSTGMRVRLAFSIAIHIQPEIIILDEVLAVGDRVFREKCIDAMAKRYADTTIVIVSHNIYYLNRICDRMIWFQNGEIVMDSNADAVLEAYLSFAKNERSKRNSPKKAISDVPTVHMDNTIHLLGIELLNPKMNQKLESIDSTLGLKIRLTYKLDRALSNCRVICRFIDKETGTIIFSTSDIDTEPRHQIERPAGTYVCEFQTPENLFTPGLYNINIIFEDPINYRVYQVWGQALQVRVIENRSDRLAWIDEPKEGFINYDLPWDYDQWADEIPPTITDGSDFIDDVITT